MPTEKKAQNIEELRGLMESSSIIITTDYTGMSVAGMTNLRRALREKGIRYTIVKNTLAHRAADAAGRPAIKNVVEGPTGVAFGFGEPTESAKTISDFIRTSRLSLKVRGGVLEGERALSESDVESLANMPSKDILVSRLLGQLQAPITGLVYVLNGPISGLARVLQRHIEQTQETPA